ncbi:hypothetical protein KBC79_00730 [Candidatus Woesebacteria bacterium]|nr:hypothetical protein [Candidatus Woesebacteria bacterium]
MKQELQTHRLAYTALIAGLICFVVFILGVWPDKFLIRLASVLLGVSYICWGVFTHHSAGDLTAHVTKEYVGASVLATALLWLTTI